MSDIVLATLNAKYIHAAFGLRYLMANLGALQSRACILEFDISGRPVDIVDSILAQNPTIVGLGVYIWNVEQTTRVVADLKRLRPKLTIVIGGPEVSYELEQQDICRMADYIVTGEGDIAFRHLCESLVAGRKPLIKVIKADEPEFAAKTRDAVIATDDLVQLPYHLYSDTDITRRVMYVEASRGCPFKCEFCLSSLDVPVRNVQMDDFLKHMQRLLDRGAMHFKFVDRTFNLNLNISRQILEFFLERYKPGLFLHFEMIPDRLPEQLRTIIAKFPEGVLQFEVGIQTFNEEVEKLISRRQDHDKLNENLTWLHENTGVHIHADLIVGLPGEDIESFGKGFDRLIGLRPQEIQVGILKRLRGTPIVRHDADWEMVYSQHPPYEILQTKVMPFDTIQRMRRFARYWDLVANSGNFTETLQLILSDQPFAHFLQLSDWLFETTQQTHNISLSNLTELLFNHLTQVRKIEPKQVAEIIWKDYTRVGRSDRPVFLRPYVEASVPRGKSVAKLSRQDRHRGTATTQSASEGQTE